MAEGFRIGLIQKRHSGQVHFAHLQSHGQQVLHRCLFSKHRKGLVEEAVHGLFPIAQDGCVIGIGRHAPDAEEDQGLEGPNVLLGVPQGFHIIVIIVAAGRGAQGAVRNDPVFLRPDLPDQGLDGVIFKVYIGDAGKQGLLHQDMGVLGQQVHIIFRRPGQAHQSAGQFVLQCCRFGGLSAGTGGTGAAGTVGGLLTLEAKHIVHRVSP